MPRVTIAKQRSTSNLTPTEHEVIELVARGLSNAEVAWRRGVSVSTICNQLTTAYRKLRVASRRELRAASNPASSDYVSLSPQWRRLSSRERQVLALVGVGHANKVIAPIVGASVSTVSTLLTRARRKLASSAPMPPATPPEREREQQQHSPVRLV